MSSVISNVSTCGTAASSASYLNSPFLVYMKKMQEEDERMGIRRSMDDPDFKLIAYQQWRVMPKDEQEVYREMARKSTTIIPRPMMGSSSFPQSAAISNGGDRPESLILVGCSSASGYQPEPKKPLQQQPQPKQPPLPQPKQHQPPQPQPQQKSAIQTYKNFLNDRIALAAPAPPAPPFQQKHQNPQIYRPPPGEDRDDIPEQLPDVDDISVPPKKTGPGAPHPHAGIRISEPYQMIDNIPEEIRCLTARIRNEYITFPYIIASSNVFVKNGDLCIPAEIGMTKFSFRHGITGFYHSFIDPQEIPIVEVPNVVEFSAEYHKIPHEAFAFPELAEVLKGVHAFTHLIDDGCGGPKQAYIFVEYDEMEQIGDVFSWFKAKSKELNLGLEWHLTFINLRTLFTFLKGRLPLTNWDESDAFVAFKTGKYDYSDLCFYHDQNDCRHCAISKAYIYCYILSEYFFNGFGVKRLSREQDKNGAWKNVPN